MVKCDCAVHREGGGGCFESVLACWRSGRGQSPCLPTACNRLKAAYPTGCAPIKSSSPSSSLPGTELFCSCVESKLALANPGPHSQVCPPACLSAIPRGFSCTHPIVCSVALIPDHYSQLSAVLFPQGQASGLPPVFPACKVLAELCPHFMEERVVLVQLVMTCICTPSAQYYREPPAPFISPTRTVKAMKQACAKGASAWQ